MPIWVQKAGSPTTVKFSSPQEIVIDAATDSISSWTHDGTGTAITSTTKSSKQALDVNDVSGSQTPLIANVITGSAGVETSYTFPALTRRIQVKSRGITTIQFSYTVGTSGTTFVTIPPRGVYTEENLCLTSSLTLYFQANKASQTVEILSWT